MDDETFAVLSIILGLIISLAFLYGWHTLCSMYSDVASSKNYSSKKFYWLCFFFGLPAMILILSFSEKAKPTYNNTPTITPPTNNSNIPVVNKSKVTVINNEWTCPKCNTKNPVSRGSCTKCGTYR